MYVENVFKEKNSDGYTYFYWYSLQGEGGQTVEESESYIDKKHTQNIGKTVWTEYKNVDPDTYDDFNDLGQAFEKQFSNEQQSHHKSDQCSSVN